MAGKGRKNVVRITTNIPSVIIEEWEQAMRQHYDVFVQMLSRSQRLELAVVAHTRLMQSGGGGILPPKSGSGGEQTKSEDDNPSRKDDVPPSRWHSEEGRLVERWRARIKRA